jgi:predicted alpha-1,2-mannosidase
MIKLKTFLLAGAVASFSVSGIFSQNTEKAPELNELSNYVNPFVGTQGDGNTFPGAVAPFGLVQLSPDTEKKDWGAASGYEYTDSTLYGFSMNHFNGTGIPDLGDFLFVPSNGQIKYLPGRKVNPDSGYITRFTHQKEVASPGYYSVFLPEHNIKVELTATERAGILKFTFPKSDSANIMVDLAHVLQWEVIWSNVRIENNQLVTGAHQVRGWAKERYVYFAARYSSPFDESGIINDGKKVIYNTYRFRSKYESAGKKLQYYARYNTHENEIIMVKVGISAISTANALENLDNEIPGWDFNKVVVTTREKWNNELQRITIEGDRKEKETFYTSMYHAFLTPNVYQDVNGTYRGFDQNVHKADNFTNYTIFSLWDTYRAIHPLFNLIQADRNADMIKSMLAHYDQSVDHLLPVWSFYNNETWCMIGYHSVSVIADAYLKGIRNFDIDKAYKAIRSTAMNPDYDNLLNYTKLGYVPYDLENESVSKTLEYAYDDYCIALMAKDLGKTDDYQMFMKRAMSYQNIFDPATKFMRGKDSKGNWRIPFFPNKYEGQTDFTEATSWQYTWYVPQDVQGLINLMGGNKPFSSKLDSLFIAKTAEDEKGIEDIHGIIGQYWHGNEPSHHIAYLYNYAGQPWKTQAMVHKIMKTQYGNQPNSLCGNDDCGQMSAWYIFNVLGFYPVCPVNDQFIIGSPCAREATVRLSNGKTFRMEATNYAEKNVYIQSVTLNGKKWDKTYIPYNEIRGGGKITYVMGPKPNKKWGTAPDSKPVSISDLTKNPS